MATQTEENIHLYDSREDIKISKPYATISSWDLSLIIKCFTSWAIVLAKNPDLAKILRNLSTAHILLLTDVRIALLEAVHNQNYPKVILPMSKYMKVMSLMRLSQSLTYEFIELFAEENQRWNEDYRP